MRVTQRQCTRSVAAMYLPRTVVLPCRSWRARVIVTLPMIATIALAACQSSGVTAPLRVTYATVAVSNGSPHLGDTTTARAIAFSAQLPVPSPGPFTWSVADSTIVHLEATTSSDRVIAHAVKPGTTVLRATVSGVTGAGGISVVP